jgi:hypothetical protein
MKFTLLASLALAAVASASPLLARQDGPEYVSVLSRIIVELI